MTPEKMSTRMDTNHSKTEPLSEAPFYHAYKTKAPEYFRIQVLLARRKRFELLTFWSVARRSIQLS